MDAGKSSREFGVGAFSKANLLGKKPLKKHHEGLAHDKTEDSCFSVARAIFGLRYVFVIGWLALAVFLAPFAYQLVLRAAPMTKKPPSNTASSAAMEVFEAHYQHLAILRREMVVLRCKQHCPTAGTVMAKGFVQQLTDIVKRFETENPGMIVQIHSYFEFAGHHQLGENPMISRDQQAILLQWIWRVPPASKAKAEALCDEIKAEISFMNDYESADGLEVSATGLVFLDHAMKETIIEEIPVHEISTIWLPFLILAVALRSGRMLLLALLPMPIEILVAFGLMYFVSLQTTVVLFALMMMLMLCTSLSFDYSLFTLTRYAEERAAGEEVEPAILTVISQSGRVVVVSGCVLMIAWAAMLGLPSPFNGFCVAACSMILTCVLVQLTFVPSLLAILPFLGSPRAERGHDEEGVGIKPKSTFHDDAYEKAKPHMQGPYFTLGGVITRSPWNVIVPLAIYLVMAPLTNRMSRNFDLAMFKFKMGHSFELTVPRSATEWKTLLAIQRDFPSSVGILMPMMIMMTGAGPLNASAVIDVSNQDAFDANCQMADALIRATRGRPYALDADHFVSATFHGEQEDTKLVDCNKYWEINMVRTNYLSQHLFLTHTSAHLQELWSQLVSEHKHAMLTFLFPTMDPFSPQAFELFQTVREALEEETITLRQRHPGISFLTFSPGSVLMDLIDVTSGQLPLCFVCCAMVCLTLIAFWFGSALIPFKLLLTVIVPITWTYGAGLFVYEDGWLNFLGYPGLGTTGDAGIDWTVPMFTLTFMMGLALDYEIFLFERVREFREEGFGDRESIQLGLAATGGTISSAGLIMALTFVAQLLGSIPVTNQMGFILVFSIVVDTFVVRSILVPAMLSILPCTNYWPSKMPEPKYEWLSLRPRGDIEGDEDDDDDDATE
mmetsp:Transcript_9776/g.28371  ORF Transcript_9776/g.28371 Transcript_9776/m.28371 type:complete len:897 (-) Transcript_9776:226-2916(-)